MLLTRTAQGFTLVELLAVLILAGVLAAVAMPRLDVVERLRADGWREETVAGLRLARATAVGHRRLVCASFDANGLLQLRLAAANPATSCTLQLAGPGGGERYGSSRPGAAVTVNPTGTLYFLPSGQVAQDGAGTQVSARDIVVTGTPGVRVHGYSGHVE